jgi:hypothetical protein
MSDLIESDVLNAASKLVACFGENRVADYFNCFSSDADFIFYTYPNSLPNRSAYEALWKSWVTENDFKILECKSTDQKVRVLDANLALFTHTVETTLSTTGGTEKVLERESIIFQKIEDSWLAIHEHLSPLQA